jgi:hypothetical protein
MRAFNADLSAAFLLQSTVAAGAALCLMLL